MHEISLHRIKEYMCTVGGAETNCEQQPKTSTGFPEVQRLKSINTLLSLKMKYLIRDIFRFVHQEE